MDKLSKLKTERNELMSRVEQLDLQFQKCSRGSRESLALLKEMFTIGVKISVIQDYIIDLIYDGIPKNKLA